MATQEIVLRHDGHDEMRIIRTLADFLATYAPDALSSGHVAPLVRAAHAYRGSLTLSAPFAILDALSASNGVVWYLTEDEFRITL